MATNSAFTFGGMSGAEVMRADNVTELKNLGIAPSKIAFMVAKAVMGDNLGGFYRWDPDASGMEDTTYLNTIPSNLSETGRWIRVFQKAQMLGGNAVMVRNGSLKTVYTPGVTNSSGEVVVYLTDTGLSTGNAIYTEVWSSQCEATANLSSANDALVITRKTLSNDLKTLTYVLARGNNQTLGGTLLAILGTVITGLRAAPSGVVCSVRVDGI